MDLFMTGVVSVHQIESVKFFLYPGKTFASVNLYILSAHLSAAFSI